MPALDYCHPHIVRALENDGWTVRDTITVAAATRTVYIDIEAVRNSNGTSQIIFLAEVKCFPDRDSTTREVYVAIGQYLVYRTILAQENVVIPLYLAIPEEVYETVFDQIVKQTMSDSQIKLLVVNIEEETIAQWIE